MDLKRVEELIELMRQSGVRDLSLELPEYKISISREPEGTRVATTGEPPRSEPSDVEGAGLEQPPSEREEAQGLSVVAPVVGVFHNGGMLDPREMVGEGDRVREGQVIAAIEAMKVPNELRSPVSGLVTRLLVEDGSAVEYGQTLFLIEPERGGEGTDDDTSIGFA
ncbi:MAG: biotin/lipoyl-binding protein [Armatimonadetes bacterium]|nr:biotin/lipoyl-binding protein [Armatimonadota bacterium]